MREDVHRFAVFQLPAAAGTAAYELTVRAAEMKRAFAADPATLYWELGFVEAHFGLVDYWGHPKPAHAACAQLIQRLDGKRFSRRFELPEGAAGSPQAVAGGALTITGTPVFAAVSNQGSNQGIGR